MKYILLVYVCNILAVSVLAGFRLPVLLEKRCGIIQHSKSKELHDSNVEKVKLHKSKMMKQLKSTSLVATLFWYGAPMAVTLVTKIGCIAAIYVDSLVSLIDKFVRNTFHSLKDILFDDKQVIRLRLQYAFFMVVSWDTISEICEDMLLHSKQEVEKRDRVMEVFQEGKLVSWRIFRSSELFALGAFARAIQMCTPLQYTFNPSVGVAALVNFGSLRIMRRAKWFSCFVVGWTTTSRLWKYCGAFWNDSSRNHVEGNQKKCVTNIYSDKTCNNFEAQSEYDLPITGINELVCDTFCSSDPNVETENVRVSNKEQ